LNIEELA